MMKMNKPQAEHDCLNRVLAQTTIILYGLRWLILATMIAISTRYKIHMVSGLWGNVTENGSAYIHLATKAEPCKRKVRQQMTDKEPEVCQQSG